MPTPDDVFKVERADEGYCRYDDPEEGTKFGRWYSELTGAPEFGRNGVAFCAMGQSYAFDKAGQSASGLPTAACGDIRRAAIANGTRVPRYQARYGDLVLFRWDGNVDDLSFSDHVGYCVVNFPGNGGGSMQTFEYNTVIGGRDGSVGHRVRDYKYIQMVIRPDYDGGAAPVIPGGLKVDGFWGTATTRLAQEVAGAPYKDGAVSRQNPQHKGAMPACTSGWDWVYPDGEKPGSQLIKSLQKTWGVPAAECDGIMGPSTIDYMIMYYQVFGSGATLVDSRLDAESPTVKAFQRRLNAGKI